jgi:predicted nucleic acid-binding protein
LRTQEWWDQESGFFDLWVSRFTLQELEAGVYSGQEAAFREARRLKSLPPTGDIHEAVAAYLEARLVPEGKPVDAFQLAIAAAHRMDYLMTWNQAHLANPEMRERLEAANAERGWRTPWIVTPDNIPRVSLGQTIRRRDG